MHWFFCLWNSPQYEQSCAIQLGQPQSVCSASNKSSLIGTSHSCDLQIQTVSEANMGHFGTKYSCRAVRAFSNYNQVEKGLVSAYLAPAYLPPRRKARNAKLEI